MVVPYVSENTKGLGYHPIPRLKIHNFLNLVCIAIIVRAVSIRMHTKYSNISKRFFDLREIYILFGSRKECIA
jgi:hypothetical protein